MSENYNNVPKKEGWYWWKATPSSEPREMKISKSDIDGGLAQWGGIWEPFPSYEEVSKSRKELRQTLESLERCKCL